MADEPTHWELSRRLDAQEKRLEQGLASIASRLDELPSEKTLLALLATRDAHMQALADDVRAVEKAVAAEARAREAAVLKEEVARKSENEATERRATAARNFAIGAIGLTVSALLGVLGFINQIGGAG